MSLPPEGAPFWDFSWDEMAAYDLPANVDRVLAATGHSQLAYVGASEIRKSVDFENPRTLRPEDSRHVWAWRTLALVVPRPCVTWVRQVGYNNKYWISELFKADLNALRTAQRFPVDDN